MNQTCKKLIANENGFTLINLIISSAVGLIVIVTFMVFTTQQQKSIGRMTQKLEALDLETVLTQHVSNSRYCSCLLSQANAPRVSTDGQLKLNMGNVAGHNNSGLAGHETKLELRYFPIIPIQNDGTCGYGAAAGERSLLAIDQYYSDPSLGLKVKAIGIHDIHRVGTDDLREQLAGNPGVFNLSLIHI